MKRIEKLKLTNVTARSIQKKDLSKLKGGAYCTSYNCSCGGTFTTGLTDAVLEDDSRR